MAAEPKKPVGEEFVFPDEKEQALEPEGGEKPPASPDTPPEAETDVEIVSDVPEVDRNKELGVSKRINDVTEEELAEHTTNVQKRLKELSFARHDERRQKEQALRERQEAQAFAQRLHDENKRLRDYVANGEKIYQGTAKSAAQAKLDMAKQKYKAAHEAFDADALVTAQQEMISAQMELQAAENFRPLQPQQEGVYPQATEPRPDERAIQWRTRNPWFGTDDEMTALALAHHKRLLASGMDPRSDEYYKSIDSRIRQKFPEYFTDTPPATQPEKAAQQPHRKPATVVAPTVRSGSAKKITLTQTQADLAKRLGIPLEEYAKQVAALESQNG